MPGFVHKRIDDMATANGEIVKLAGAELGVESFGIQVFDFEPNFPDYPEHDHAAEEMEEIYVVLEGSADVEVGGERLSLERGSMLRVEPATKRKLLPGPDGVRILAIGASPGRRYERPEGLDLP
jgi:mannose-6-phosphate isomerase-like protein (cupin superfamily)